jgi:cob(I)alamin adenosyltransferase
MTTKNKSTVAITMIRTGHGDLGDTKLGGKTYRKGHALVELSAALDAAQSFTIALPSKMSWGKPRALMQELLFRLGAVIGSRTPNNQELALVEIGKAMEREIEKISSGLNPLDSFIRVTVTNAELQQLRAMVRLAETACVKAFDQIKLESKDIAPNLLYMLEQSMKVLNIASDWVFAYAWLKTVNEQGIVPTENKWNPMTEAAIIKLNDDLNDGQN